MVALYKSRPLLSFVQLMKIFGLKCLVLNDSSDVICSNVSLLLNHNLSLCIYSTWDKMETYYTRMYVHEVSTPVEKKNTHICNFIHLYP